MTIEKLMFYTIQGIDLDDVNDAQEIAELFNNLIRAFDTDLKDIYMVESMDKIQVNIPVKGE